MEFNQSIQNRIYEKRGERVMLDFDLAALYEVGTKVPNQAVKRNISCFPDDLLFQVTHAEWANLMSQFVTLNRQGSDFQLVNTQMKRGYQLRSERAIQINIAIIRAFVAIRKMLLLQTDTKEQHKLIKERMEELDVQLAQIYLAIGSILGEIPMNCCIPSQNEYWGFHVTNKNQPPKAAH